MASIALTAWFARSQNSLAPTTRGSDTASGLPEPSSAPNQPAPLKGPPGKEQPGRDGEDLGAGTGSPAAIAKTLHMLVSKGTPRGYAEVSLRLSDMSAEEAPFALEFLSTCSRASENMWSTLWRRWGAVDLVGAMEQAESAANGYGHDNAIKEIFSGLGESAPQDAANYILSNPNFPARNRAIEGLAVQWALSNSEQATQWAVRSLSGEDLKTACYAIPWAINQIEGDGSELHWWRALEDEGAKRSAYDAIASIYRQHSRDPERSIALAEAGLEQGIRHPAVLSTAAATLGVSDPEHGLKLFTQFGPDSTSGSSFYTGLDTFFANWARQDSVAAGERLSGMLNEPWADTAILGYARSIEETDPDAASQWLSRIKDQTIRSRANR